MHQSLLAKDQLMEEFQEDDVLWSDGEHQDDDDTVLEKQPSTRQQARRKESAPVDIPPKARVGASRSWAPRCSFHDSDNNSMDGDYDDDDDDFGNNSSDERIPPHIIVARRTSDKMAFSVCVGKGRTLKGRDLYRVRNAILRMTGFLER
ncbi:uncharacterized protein LOC120107324 [Phoenix dactylifera]|nr:uncharacterized protein LOC120107324 [Phoenix dactylifera]